MSSTQRIAIWGLGGVGRALLEDLVDRPLAGAEVVALADSRATWTREAGTPLPEALARKRETGRLPSANGPSVEDLVEKGAVDVLVDVTPTDLETGQPAVEMHARCLARDIDVVTANKGPLALAGPKLRAQAGDGATIRAEATVGGGIPVLSTIRRLRSADRIEGVDAVPNGSTSRVLDRIADGDDWDGALREAREAGLLEADPTYDVDGWDAAAKAAILAQEVLDAPVTLADVDRAGLDDLSADAIRDARRQGLAPRLVARVTPDGVRVRVAELPGDSPLVVPGLGNAYRIHLSDGEETLLAGPGAGPAPTATALRRDLRALVGPS